MSNTNSTNGHAPRQIEFSGPPEPEENAWSSFGFVWRRLWLVVLAVIVSLGLGYLYYLKQPPVFQSSAQMLIVKRKPAMPLGGVPQEAGYDDTTHETLLRSSLVIRQAVEKHRLQELSTLRGSSNPVGQIIAGLKVEGIAGDSGDIIKFSYSSASSDDCPAVLNALIDSYTGFLGETYQNVNQETLDLIGQAKDVLDSQIAKAQQDYQAFRGQTELLYLGGEGKNVHEGRLQQIETMRSSLEVEKWKDQAKIDAIEAALKRGGSREALNLMIGQVREADSSAEAATPGSARSIESQLFPLLMEEQMLLENFGPDHPKVATVRKRIQVTREHLLGPGQADAAEPRDFYEVYLDSLRQQIQITDEQLASMARMQDEESRAAKEMDKYQIQDANYRGDIERKERMFEAVVARLEEINVSKEFDLLKAQVIDAPGLGYQVAPDMGKTLALSGFLGLLAGLGLAYVIDSLDRRFRSPDDIRSDLGLPVIGHIPTIPGSERKSAKKEETEPSPTISPALRVYHHPRGRIAEAYRAVRTALYFSTRGSGHKVVQVTSPNPGDGKTTLAANLAVAIANSGKRTLLIDCDFRRPRVHKVFGLGDGTGMSDVMSGSVELIDAIIETTIEGLSILPCGRRPANPAELLTSNKFQELLDVLREKYDMVIIDTPPVLAVTDPLTVAPRVDGVLLVIRLAKSARSSAQKTLEALDSIGGTVLGIVVNGMGGGSKYGYGYGSYSYGYRYGGYGYRYGSRYGGYGKGYGYGYGYGQGYGYGYGDRDGDGTGEQTYVTDDDGRTRREDKPGAGGEDQDQVAKSNSP